MIKGNTSAGTIFACMPVDSSTMALEFPELVEKMPKVPYPNSEKGTCDFCGDEVWVGPRVGVARQVDTESQLSCFRCAAHAIRAGQVGKMFELGGEE